MKIQLITSLFTTATWPLFLSVTPVIIDVVIIRRREQSLLRAQHGKEDEALRNETVQLITSSDSSTEASDSDSSNTPSAPKRSCRAKKIITPELTAALDRTKLSDRSAVHILSAAASALGHNPSDLAINRSSIRRSRRTQRKEIAEDLQRSNEISSSLTVHWDG